ncbi:hypothetical protein [Streptomyces sp. NRRL B-1347]|uniref:hypothetical protein n=1 Tax=Streptomyces sp. NRRL B-1347 TaxID=1476877 RepID=UPI000A6064A3|nr:hypothetical protein [Streptomyces sp. NRRL B-1347]
MIHLISTLILAAIAVCVVVLPAAVVASRTETDRTPEVTLPGQRDRRAGRGGAA